VSKEDKTGSWSSIIIAIIGALATVTAAAIGLIGTLAASRAGRRKGREERAEEIKQAPRLYVEHLDRLIKEAVREGEQNAVLNARAIVATAKDLRDSTITISERLNSEINRLDREVSTTEDDPAGKPSHASQKEIYETIQVLAKKWPAKKDQVEVEITKILAELKLLSSRSDRE
jgi:hypothetical protein